MANKGKRMLFEDEYRYLDKVIETYPDPTDIGGGGSEYTAGYGINIDTNDAISIKTDVVATLGNNNTFTKTNTFTSSLQVLKSNPGLSLVSNTADNKYAQITYQDSNITQASLRLSTSSNNTTRLYSGVAGVEIISGGKTYTFDTTSGGTVATTSDIPAVTNTISQGSTAAVTSGAVYDAIGDIETLLAAI